MNTMRNRLKTSAVSASVAQSLVLAALDEAGWDTSSQGDFECMAGDSGLVAPPRHETPGMLGRVSNTPGLLQMPEGVRGQPTGLSDRYFELIEFDGRVAGSVAGVAPPIESDALVPPVPLRVRGFVHEADIDLSGTHSPIPKDSRKVVRDLVIETHGASRDDQTQTWHAIIGVPLHGIHSIPILQPRRLFDLQHMADACGLTVRTFGKGTAGNGAAHAFVTGAEVTPWVRGPAYFLVCDTPDMLAGGDSRMAHRWG